MQNSSYFTRKTEYDIGEKHVVALVPLKSSLHDFVEVYQSGGEKK